MLGTVGMLVPEILQVCTRPFLPSSLTPPYLTYSPNSDLLEVALQSFLNPKFTCLTRFWMQANGAGDIKGARWFEAGAAMLDVGKLNYFGFEIPFTLQGVIVINAALIFLVEWFRFQEFSPGYEPDCEDTLYPGGPFDPLGLADDPGEFAV